jgi:hypothetical protein
MKLPDITAWLASGCDFKQGVALYAALGASATYQRLFSLGATDYSRQVLVRELSALVPAVEPAPMPVPPPPAVALQGPALAPEPPPAGPAPQLLANLRQQLRAARDERSHLHPQLTAKNVGKKARLAVCLRIVVLTAEEVKLKALEKHVLQHGRLPGPVATADVTDETELRRRLLTLRTRRSKLKGKPEKAEKLAAIEAEIMLIQSKITT